MRPHLKIIRAGSVYLCVMPWVQYLLSGKGREVEEGKGKERKGGREQMEGEGEETVDFLASTNLSSLV